MNKKNLFRCTILAFAMLFAVISAPAQSINSYRAHVPFDFVVGQKSYESGDYLIRFEQQSALAMIFTLSTAEGRELQAAAVMKNGKTSRSDRTMLVFNRYGDDYVLRQISSPTYGFWAPRADTATWVTVTENLGKKPETVSVSLNR